jgi:hypothetical protein
LAEVGISLPEVSLILSALGWGAAAVAIYGTGEAVHRQVAAVVAAALVVSSPIVVATLGTETSWVVALAWVAIGAWARRRWKVQTCASALMLGLHFEPSTLALATLLWIGQWVERKRFPWLSGLVLAGVVVGWGMVTSWQAAVPLYMPWQNLDEWGFGFQQLVNESELYWLFVLWMGLGLFAVTRKTGVIGVLGSAILLWGGGTLAWAATITLGLFLVGLGVDWVIKWIEAQGLVRLNRLALAVSLVFVAGLPLGIAQTSSLVQRYRLRPVVRLEMERQAGDWLRAHSEPSATVLSTDRIGYMADRATILWDGGDGKRETSVSLIRVLSESPPDYCVSSNTIAWNRLMRTSWFQDNYEPVQELVSLYEGASPFTIWRYRSSSFDLGEVQALNVRLPSDMRWVGYSYWPNRIEPGEAVYVKLFYQMDQPIGDSFRTVVQVVSPSDGVAWAHTEKITQRSVLWDCWQTEQVIVDQFVLTTTADIPVGAYDLKVSTMTPDLSEPVPMYRDSDTSPLDQVVLGPVVVPWRGGVEAAKPVNADLGGLISLLGFEMAESVSPGTDLNVTLYWEAQQPPDEDYIVFVHLLDAAGEIVASHDGSPVDGRYATSAWYPGDIVKDVHHLALDPFVPPGEYQLQVGMYSWPDLERLPVRDSLGREQEGQIIALQSVQVR